MEAMIKEYLGIKISFDDVRMDFTATINGQFKRFPSLQAAKKAIEKRKTLTFEPIDVLIIEEKGYRPSIAKVKQIHLVEYKEEKGYRGRLIRYVMDAKGKSYAIEGGYNHRDFYPLTAKAKLEKHVNECNEAEKQLAIADKRVDALEKQREDIATINVDPLADGLNKL